MFPRHILLSSGKVAIVDEADYEWLSRWKWSARRDNKSGRWYAFRNSPRENGKRHLIMMHREIAGLDRSDKRQVDHASIEETLDNRRSNLRVASDQQNKFNRPKQRNNTSGFKGVTKCRSVWQASISFNGQSVYLGRRATPEAAFELYRQAAHRLHGDFARAS